MDCSHCGKREAAYQCGHSSEYLLRQECYMQLAKDGWTGHRQDIWTPEAKCPNCGSTEWPSLEVG